jgi:hypothetical protein
MVTGLILHVSTREQKSVPINIIFIRLACVLSFRREVNGCLSLINNLIDKYIYDKINNNGGVGAKLSEMQIFSGNYSALSVDVHAPKPIANAWKMNSIPTNGKGVFVIGDKVKVTLTLNKRIILANVGSNKIVIAGKEFLLTGTNGTATNTLEFAYTVQANDKINAAFCINNKNDIVLNDIQDADGNTINLSSIPNRVNISPNIQNLALNSKGLATISTNITHWHANDTKANIERMTDGNTSSSGALDYATHPKNANGKHILFDFGEANYSNGSFKLYNRKGVADRINGSTVEFLKNGMVVLTRTIRNAGNIVKITPATYVTFDQVKLTFSGDSQNFREIEIFGKNSNLLIDSGAPEPLKNNAWHINRGVADSNGEFSVGDEVKITLTLDKAVTLAKVGSNKIIIANKVFLLTGTNGTTTNTLEFTRTVKVSDNINAEDFDIDNKDDIILTDVKDTDGNNINFNNITSAIELSNIPLDTDFNINGGKKITHINNIYKKTSDTGWNASITSSKGFTGNGHLIAKMGSNNKHLMIGLSSNNSDNNSNSNNYQAMNFAIYMNNTGDIGSIYENGLSVKEFSKNEYTYEVGDYLKIERDATTINYYLIKANDNPTTQGTLLYTSSTVSNADTELFLESSLHDIGAKISEVKIFNDNKSSLSINPNMQILGETPTTNNDPKGDSTLNQIPNDHQLNNTSTTTNGNTTNNTQNTSTGNTQNTQNTQEQEAQKAKKAKKWFKIKTNSKFSQGLSLFQIPQIFIITELSNENFDLASSLGKNNNIVIYYNAKNNEIDYLYGQQNDIEVKQIEYRIIANGKIINTLVEDTTNGEYIADTDDDPKDDIDTQAIVAQLQQAITINRTNTKIHKNWFTRHSFTKKGLDINNPPSIQNRKQTTQSTNSNTPPTDTNTPSTDSNTPSTDTNTPPTNPNTSRYQSNIIIPYQGNTLDIGAVIAIGLL